MKRTLPHHPVRLHRLLAGLTQQEVAAELGVSQTSVSLIERRWTEATAAQVRRLAKLFKCKPDDLRADESAGAAR